MFDSVVGLGCGRLPLPRRDIGVPVGGGARWEGQLTWCFTTALVTSPASLAAVHV